MSVGTVKIKNIAMPEFSDREILRYAGVRDDTNYDKLLFEKAKSDVSKIAKACVVYREMPIEINEYKVSFGNISVVSKSLAQAMRKAKQVLFFAATVGIEVDRLIAKQSRISASAALATDAVATERIEALCDEFCRRTDFELLPYGLHTGIRFSPGYGDMPLEFQREIFSVILPERSIGLTLNSSLMMSPSKSVSAIIAIEELE